LKGSLEDMRTPSRIGRVKSSGELEFDDAELVINEEAVVLDKGSLRMKDNSIIVDDIKLEGAGSELVLNGKFLNLIPVLFAASFTNGKKRNNAYSVFKVDNFKGYFNRELIESSLRIADLDHPRIEFSLDGVLPLESIYGLLNAASITDGDGEIEIKKLYLKGSLEDMRTPSRIGRVKSSGELEFDDAELCATSCLF
ncbi:MAG: hypothetical protein AAFV25_24405, partial [Bacteroidota bacterium]